MLSDLIKYIDTYNEKKYTIEYIDVKYHYEMSRLVRTLDEHYTFDKLKKQIITIPFVNHFVYLNKGSDEEYIRFRASYLIDTENITYMNVIDVKTKEEKRVCINGCVFYDGVFDYKITGYKPEEAYKIISFEFVVYSIEYIEITKLLIRELAKLGEHMKNIEIRMGIDEEGKRN